MKYVDIWCVYRSKCTISGPNVLKATIFHPYLYMFCVICNQFVIKCVSEWAKRTCDRSSEASGAHFSFLLFLFFFFFSSFSFLFILFFSFSSFLFVFFSIYFAFLLSWRLQWSLARARAASDQSIAQNTIWSTNDAH